MAKYTVTYSCGHTGTVELIGKSADRESKILWYETKAVCPDCHKANKAIEQQEMIASAEAAHILPALIGSEKQIAWATAIRAKMIAELEAYTVESDKYLDKTPGDAIQREAARARRNNAIDQIMATSDAGWWINNRNTNVYTLVKDLAK